MPEGDTIHRIASRLGALLPGEQVTYAWNRQRGALDTLCGQRITTVEARGKNLLIALTGGYTLRVHLGIAGRCNCRPKPTEPPPIHWATLVLDTDAHRMLVWKTSRADLVRTAHVRAAPGIRTLGPDLLSETCDLDEVIRRARATGNRTRPLGELLLDQRVAAGIGNVVRCEALYLARADPFTPTQAIDDDTLLACFRHAQAILEQSIRTGRRDTTSEAGERYFVYGRPSRPCLTCGARIQVGRQSDLARATYHCPSCQKPPPPQRNGEPPDHLG